MAEKKKALSRGLDAIFNDGSTGQDLQAMIDAIEKKAPAMSQIFVSLDEITPNPYQPRKHFDEEKLEELAQSIREHGVFQPLLLKKTIHGYNIVAGERRYRASKIAKLTEVPAIIVDLNDDQMMEIALLENIQREDLNAIEEAQAYRTMMDSLSLTQEQLSKRIGKSRAHIANTLRLLTISQELQNYILEGKLSMGHIRPLIGLDEEKALDIAKRAYTQSLSVRQVEDIVKGLKLSEAKKNKPKKEKNPEHTYVEGLIRKKLRTKVKVEDSSITIKYTDTDDLNRILELIGVIEDI